MSNRLKALVAGIGATAILVIATTAVSANRLSVDDLTFGIVARTIAFTTPVGTTTCQLTLGGSFHARTFTKADDALIGSITSSGVGNCVGGSATVLAGTLPWHVPYSGFLGRLPNVTGLRFLLSGMAVTVSSSGIDCLFRTDSVEPAGGVAIIEAGGAVTEFIFDETYEIDLDDPGFLCSIAGDMSLSGTGSVADGAGEAIHVDLI